MNPVIACIPSGRDTSRPYIAHVGDCRDGIHAVRDDLPAYPHSGRSRLRPYTTQLQLLIFAVLTALITGCTFTDPIIAEFEEDTDPDYVMRVFVSEVTPISVCIEMDLETVWQPGDGIDSDRDVNDTVSHTMTVMVDGLDMRNNLHIEQKDVPYEMYDEAGNLIGSYGGPLLVCTDVAELSSGRHVLQIEFENTSGDVFDYAVEFDVVAGADGIEIEIAD